MDGKSTVSLPVSPKERGTVLEGSLLLKTPLPNLPNTSCRTLRGVGSWRLSRLAVAAQWCDARAGCPLYTGQWSSPARIETSPGRAQVCSQGTACSAPWRIPQRQLKLEPVGVLEGILLRYRRWGCLHQGLGGQQCTCRQDRMGHGRAHPFPMGQADTESWGFIYVWPMEIHVLAHASPVLARTCVAAQNAPDRDTPLSNV